VEAVPRDEQEHVGDAGLDPLGLQLAGHPELALPAVRDSEAQPVVQAVRRRVEAPPGEERDLALVLRGGHPTPTEARCPTPHRKAPRALAAEFASPAIATGDGILRAFSSDAMLRRSTP
jgi:hypothetical protein